MLVREGHDGRHAGLGCGKTPHRPARGRFPSSPSVACCRFAVYFYARPCNGSRRQAGGSSGIRTQGIPPRFDEPRCWIFPAWLSMKGAKKSICQFKFFRFAGHGILTIGRLGGHEENRKSIARLENQLDATARRKQGFRQWEFGSRALSRACAAKLESTSRVVPDTSPPRRLFRGRDCGDYPPIRAIFYIQ